MSELPDLRPSLPPGPRPAIGYLLLLIAGAFGAHRFYYGKSATGAAQLGLLFCAIAMLTLGSIAPIGVFVYDSPLDLLFAWLLVDLISLFWWRRA